MSDEQQLADTETEVSTEEIPQTREQGPLGQTAAQRSAPKTVRRRPGGGGRRW